MVNDNIALLSLQISGLKPEREDSGRGEEEGALQKAEAHLRGTATLPINTHSCSHSTVPAWCFTFCNRSISACLTLSLSSKMVKHRIDKQYYMAGARIPIQSKSVYACFRS